MHQNSLTMKTATIATVSLLIVLICASGSQAAHRIRLKVQDTSVVVGQSFDLKLFLDNPVDSVAGFTFLLAMNRPDIARFDFSGMGCDTSGTLTSGAELIGVSDPSGNGTHLKFTCFYDFINNPSITPPLAPQSGGVLVKLRINTFLTPFPLDDSLDILIVPSAELTNFSDPSGDGIGVVSYMIVDTIGFRCLQWNGTNCLAWDQCADIENCTDSLFIHTLLEQPRLDTAQVALINGRSFISLPNCDNNGNMSVNVSDAVCVIKYLFGGFNQSICPTFHCDANNSGGVNIADVTYLIKFLFGGGPPPH